MEPKEYVLMLLKNYSRMMREAASLRFELKNFVKIGDDEIIEGMALSSKMGDGIRSGRIADKTTDIALRYREVADKVNEEAYKAVLHRLNALETAVSRLDFYLGQLDKTQAEVLQGYYFGHRTWREMQEGTELTVKTLRKLRDAAVTFLAGQYALLFSLSIISEEEKRLFP